MNKFIAFGMVATAVTFAGCTDEYDYQPAQKGEGGNAYIVGQTHTVLGFQGDDPLTFQIKLQRTNTDAAESVKLTSDNPSIKLPDKVDFAAGEKNKTVDIPFDTPEATTQTAVIAVAPENASHYGVTSATYVLEHYKVHKADYQSKWFGNTWNDITVLESGNRHYKLLIPLKDRNGNAFQPVEMVVDDKNEVYVYPQPAYADISNAGDLVMLYVVGNWNGDASKLYTDADIEKVSGYAGQYDPKEEAFYLNFFWYAPNYGWWGWNDETIYLLN